MTQLISEVKQIRGYFVKGLLVALAIAAAIGIWTLLTASFGSTEGKILLSTLLVGIYAVLCLCCLTVAGRSQEVVGILGVISSSVSLLAGLWLVWFGIANWGNDTQSMLEFMFKTFYLTGVVGFSLAHASLILLLVGQPSVLVQRLVLSTLSAIGVVALMLIYPIVNNFQDLPEAYWRFLGVFAILDVVGTIATPVIAKLNKH